MNPRDRVFQALDHLETDICPYYIWVHDEMIAPLAEHYGNPDFKEGTIVDHSVMREVTASQTAPAPGVFRDEFGCLWKQGAALHLEQPALRRPSLSGYSMPDLTTPEHFDGLQLWLDRYSDRFRIVQLGILFFERAWCLRGFEQFFMDMIEHPAFAGELLDELAANCLAVIDRLLADFGDDIEAVGFSDDFGSERSLLVSPALWRELIAPRLERMYARIRRGGKKVYLHSCGHVEPILPDLVELGVDMLQPLQPEANDIFRIKEEYGSRLCLVGGISTQRTLPFGTPDEVRREVARCLDVMARGGGYIMAPAKPILPGVPLENAVALIDAMTRQDGVRAAS